MDEITGLILPGLNLNFASASVLSHALLTAHSYLVPSAFLQEWSFVLNNMCKSQLLLLFFFCYYYCYSTQTTVQEANLPVSQTLCLSCVSPVEILLEYITDLFTSWLRFFSSSMGRVEQLFKRPWSLQNLVFE